VSSVASGSAAEARLEISRRAASGRRVVLPMMAMRSRFFSPNRAGRSPADWHRAVYEESAALGEREQECEPGRTTGDGDSSHAPKRVRRGVWMRIV